MSPFPRLLRGLVSLVSPNREGGGPGWGSSPARSGKVLLGALLFGLLSYWPADGSRVGLGPFLAWSVLQTLRFSGVFLSPFGGLGYTYAWLINLWLRFGAPSGFFFLA